MSGLEVVGLLLGAIPILISALEQYQKTIAFFENAVHKKRHIDHLIMVLRQQEALFTTEIEIMLRNAGKDEEDLVKVSFGPEYWLTGTGAKMNSSDLYRTLQDKTLECDIQECLGRHYMPYLNAIDACHRAIADIARNIRGFLPNSEYQPAAVVDFAHLLDANGWDQTFSAAGRRLKFGLKKTQFDEKLARLDASTRMLERLAASARAVQQQQIQLPSSSTRKMATFLSLVQRNADRLHAAVARSWTTGCHQEHDTKLYLDPRLKHFQGTSSKFNNRQPVVFNLSLSTDAQIVAAWDAYHLIVVEVLDDNDAPDNKTPPSHGINWNLPNTAGALPSKPMVVSDLCQALSQARQRRNSLKFFLSLQSCLCCHEDQELSISTNPRTSRSGPSDVVSLREVLAKATNNPGVLAEWRKLQRATLSFKLASSVLQLCSTPWLAGTWNKATVFFHKTTETTSLWFDQDRPFISHRFRSTGDPCKNETWNAKRTLLELGIMLIEIERKFSFEVFAKQRSLSFTDSYGSRFDVAEIWYNDVFEDMTPWYSDAVKRCLECSFATTSAAHTWDDAELRKGVCEYVVKPLGKNARELPLQF